MIDFSESRKGIDKNWRLRQTFKILIDKFLDLAYLESLMKAHRKSLYENFKLLNEIQTKIQTKIQITLTISRKVSKILN